MNMVQHATKVEYTVKAEYAAQNKANISQVTEELRALHRTDIKYSVFVKDDGKTFNHFLLFANEEAGKVFSSLPTFKTFQAELHGSQPEVPPVVTDLTVVGSSYDLF